MIEITERAAEKLQEAIEKGDLSQKSVRVLFNGFG
jgi:hypothetical protein